MRFTSGPIPEAAELDAYAPEIQAKIIDWHEREVKAVFDDESRRQDKLVDGEVRLGYLNMLSSFVIDAAIVCGSLIAFVITGNPNVFWSYTVLGASVIGNVVVNVRTRKTKSSADNE